MPRIEHTKIADIAIAMVWFDEDETSTCETAQRQTTHDHPARVIFAPLGFAAKLVLQLS